MYLIKKCEVWKDWQISRLVLASQSQLWPIPVGSSIHLGFRASGPSEEQRVSFPPKCLLRWWGHTPCKHSSLWLQPMIFLILLFITTCRMSISQTNPCANLKSVLFPVWSSSSPCFRWLGTSSPKHKLVRCPRPLAFYFIWLDSATCTVTLLVVPSTFFCMGFSRNHKVHPLRPPFPPSAQPPAKELKYIHLAASPAGYPIALTADPLLSHPVKTPFVFDHRHSTAIHSLAVFQIEHTCVLPISAHTAPLHPGQALEVLPKLQCHELLFLRSAQQLLNYSLSTYFYVSFITQYMVFVI